MFSLYADDQPPSTHPTQEAAITAGRSAGVDSFEVYDEDRCVLVFCEYPKVEWAR